MKNEELIINGAIILAVVAIVYLAFFSSGAGLSFAGFGKVDLSKLLSPYFETTNMQGICQVTYGGTWFNTPSKVGCFNMQTPIDFASGCGNAAFKAAKLQCETVGGTAVCSQYNVGCYYP